MRSDQKNPQLESTAGGAHLRLGKVISNSLWRSGAWVLLESGEN